MMQYRQRLRVKAGRSKEEAISATAASNHGARLPVLSVSLCSQARELASTNEDTNRTLTRIRKRVLRRSHQQKYTIWVYFNSSYFPSLRLFSGQTQFPSIFPLELSRSREKQPRSIGHRWSLQRGDKPRTPYWILLY